MSGWLIAGWFLFLFVLMTIWFNWSWTRLQRRVARQRPGLDRNAYAATLAACGVSRQVSDAFYDALRPSLVSDVLSHPDDGLMGFYFDDTEDLEDLIEQMHEQLGLERTARYDPEITPHLESVRNLAVYLQSKIEAD